MHDAIDARLAELRAERERGEQMLAELQAREAGLRETLLRISGAIQVLEELRQQDGDAADAPSAAA